MGRIVAMLACVMALTIAGGAELIATDTAPHFTLTDVEDQEFSTETPRATPLIVILTTKDLGDFSLAWRDSLESRELDAGIVTVLDLNDVSRFLRPIARLKISAKGSKAFLDWDGEVSEAWRGEDNSQVVVMVVAPDNTVQTVVKGAGTSESIAEIVAATQPPGE